MASPTFQDPSNQSRLPREHEAQELFSSSQVTELRDAKLRFHLDEPTKENASFLLSSQPPEVKGFPQSTLIIFLLLWPYSMPVTNPHPTREQPNQLAIRGVDLPPQEEGTVHSASYLSKAQGLSGHPPTPALRVLLAALSQGLAVPWALGSH